MACATTLGRADPDGKGGIPGPGVTRLAILLSVLGLWLCVATAAQAARTEFFGIAQGPLEAQDAQQMADVGVRTERFMLRWRSVERTRGSYDWGPRDWLIGALASRGIRPAPFVWGSPQWVGNGAAARPPLGTAADVQAWQNFLRAAAARYGPGGSYWANGYRQRFGADATPLPIQSWQIWNEPNLKKFFAPGATAYQSAQKYARLLSLSRDAIKGRDPQAQIVLAGMPAYGDVTAWQFLNNLYGIPGAKDDFDAAALHPYARDLGGLRWTIDQFRAAMTSHGDGTTPMWFTELAWGSGPPDEFGYNKGPAGQQQMLLNSFRLILQNRDRWNVQRLFWFLWHDPPPGSDYARLCSICGTAGLVRYNRTPKPAHNAFTGFTAETTPPVARIASGPIHGSFINDPTPAFQLASSEPGSTFECRFAQSWSPCGPQFAPATPLQDGSQTFSVKAIDAPGNESAVRTRSFTVDTTAPTVDDLRRPRGGLDPVRSGPLVRLHLQRPRRQRQLPARRRRLCGLQLAVHGLGLGGRLAHLPGEGNGYRPEHPHCLAHLDRRHHPSDGIDLLRSRGGLYVVRSEPHVRLRRRTSPTSASAADWEAPGRFGHATRRTPPPAWRTARTPSK